MLKLKTRCNHLSMCVFVLKRYFHFQVLIYQFNWCIIRELTAQCLWHVDLKSNDWAVLQSIHIMDPNVPIVMLITIPFSLFLAWSIRVLTMLLRTPNWVLTLWQSQRSNSIWHLRHWMLLERNKTTCIWCIPILFCDISCDCMNVEIVRMIDKAGHVLTTQQQFWIIRRYLQLCKNEINQFCTPRFTRIHRIYSPRSSIHPFLTWF